MATLFLLRHLKSNWNTQKRFAGWGNNPLSSEGIAQAKEISPKVASEKIDVIYSNALVRCLETVTRIFENIPDRFPVFSYIDGGKMEEWGTYEEHPGDVPIYVTEILNERYYGKLQGRPHEDLKKEVGEEQVQMWRRSYDQQPPGGESMKDTYERVMPFFNDHVMENLKGGKNVLIVASGNSLRSIVKHLENMPDEDTVNFELPFGAFVKYDFDGSKFTKLQ
ncbi:histidine phosphatase family protein [Candidatus Parcubacteria bacterium]|nr:histidine phosphatase family protein [Candidatus Parcubacteria bacterium]